MNVSPSTQAPEAIVSDYVLEARWVSSLIAGDVPIGTPTPRQLSLAALAVCSPPPEMRRGEYTDGGASARRYIRDGARYIGRVTDHMNKDTVCTLGGVNGVAALVLWHAARRDFFRS